MEIFSYLLWFYIEGLVLGLILYPLIKMLIEGKSTGLFLKIVIDGFICLILLNVVSLLSAGSILTADLIMNLKEGVDLHDNNLLIHLISLFCLVCVSYLVNRKTLR
jgi:hypothetical protein